MAARETVRDDAKDLVRRAFRAWDAGDERAIESLLAPGFVQHNHEGGFWDAAEVVRLARFFSQPFPDRRTEIQHIAAEGELVAVHWVTTATHRGPYLELPPSGMAVRSEGVAFFRIAGGLIAEIWNWSASPSYYRQLTGRSAPISPPASSAEPR